MQVFAPEQRNMGIISRHFLVFQFNFLIAPRALILKCSFSLSGHDKASLAAKQRPIDWRSIV